jgi:hypothetical protein
MYVVSVVVVGPDLQGGCSSKRSNLYNKSTKKSNLDACKPDHTDSRHTHTHAHTCPTPTCTRARTRTHQWPPPKTRDYDWHGPRTHAVCLMRPAPSWYQCATISRMTDDAQLHPMRPDNPTICLMRTSPPLVCPMQRLWLPRTVLYIHLLIFPFSLFPLSCNEGIVITLFHCL